MKKQFEERKDLIQRILRMNATDFKSLALQLFQYQYKYNGVYRNYVELLGVNNAEVHELDQIPYLPIEMFKYHKVSCIQESKPASIFRSSTTSGLSPSQHFIYDLDLYHKAILNSFKDVIGKSATQFQWIGLLPSYLERQDASLVEMVRFLNLQSEYNLNDPFFLNDFKSLNTILQHNREHDIPTILVGVTFAILDWIETSGSHFPNLLLVETGGMKGRRKEITRDDLHDRINSKIQVSEISSEYGMTELMSQAYWTNNQFCCPRHMRVSGRDITDPLSLNVKSKTVALNVIDFYNIDSCCFIATDDIGEIYGHDTFNVLGRLDHSDIRGCNLMVI